MGEVENDGIWICYVFMLILTLPLSAVFVGFLYPGVAIGLIGGAIVIFIFSPFIAMLIAG
jgi:multisubunit Na+/H+ antiporter MnhG subunit